MASESASTPENESASAPRLALQTGHMREGSTVLYRVFLDETGIIPRGPDREILVRVTWLIISAEHFKGRGLLPVYNSTMIEITISLPPRIPHCGHRYSTSYSSTSTSIGQSEVDLDLVQSVPSSPGDRVYEHPDRLDEKEGRHPVDVQLYSLLIKFENPPPDPNCWIDNGCSLSSLTDYATDYEKQERGPTHTFLPGTLFLGPS
ncbi:hypothetical protein NDU88_004890 [Pleurodeles waltl]|uniref:Uncharacterized protein n=1 Tax=Pleurodeles waltl TaxID=8319 RepID=A0AAV7WWQ7_PLEWA|nr:hypothetical protein NDU88_004890 [Pleurodeles waltl]